MIGAKLNFWETMISSVEFHLCLFMKERLQNNRNMQTIVVFSLGKEKGRVFFFFKSRTVSFNAK